MNVTKAAGIAAVALAGYDALVRPRMLGWGASRGEQRMRLPGDKSPAGSRPTTPGRSPSRPRPRRSGPGWRGSGITGPASTATTGSNGFIFPGTVHYIEGTHSATRIHPELQQVHIGDRINTGSIGKKFAAGNPVTVIEPGQAPGDRHLGVRSAAPAGRPHPAASP